MEEGDNEEEGGREKKMEIGGKAEKEGIREEGRMEGRGERCEE